LKTWRGLILGAACLSLAACSFGWGGHRTDKRNDAGGEISSLRAERDDLQARLRSAKRREDTRGFRDSAFPTEATLSPTQLESRLAEINHRIDLLEKAEAAHTSTAEDSAEP